MAHPHQQPGAAAGRQRLKHAAMVIVVDQLRRFEKDFCAPGLARLLAHRCDLPLVPLIDGVLLPGLRFPDPVDRDMDLSAQIALHGGNVGVCWSVHMEGEIVQRPDLIDRPDMLRLEEAPHRFQRGDVGNSPLRAEDSRGHIVEILFDPLIPSLRGQGVTAPAAHR